MTPAEYEAMLELNERYPLVVIEPAVWEHARTRRLADEECETCRVDGQHLKFQWATKMFRLANAPQSRQQKMRMWYLDRRYAILQRLWIWGLRKERRTWAV